MRTEKQLLPQAIEYEESVLSSCLLGEAEKVAELLTPEDFYRTGHQKIFKVICETIKKGIAVDLHDLVMKLKDAGQLAEVGGASYIASLLNTVPVATNVQYYCRKIRDKAVLRTLLVACQETTRACLDKSNEVAVILDKAKNRLDSIMEVASSMEKKAVCYRELSLDAGERYDTLYKRKGAITGLASGFYVLDFTLCGFHAGDLSVIAARPSQGKTALALNIAGNIASKGIAVAFFSLEMSASQLFDRHVASASGINLQKFRTGRFEKADWEKINEAQEKAYTLPVYIDDSAELHYQEIWHRAWALKKQHEIGLCIIDHLQLIKGDREATTRDREIGGITSSLKALAKELGIPVIVLSQLNRQVETRPNPYKRPRLSDLRDSGNIEQDSDVIIFLYRPVVYEDKEDFPGHTELIIAKHRNGPTGMVKLLWNDKITTFLNPD